MPLRLRQLALSLPVLARTAPWGVLVGAGALGAFAVALCPASAVELWLRVAAVLLAAVSPAVLDDDASTTVAPCPTPVPTHRAWRAGGALLVLGAAWTAILTVAARRGHVPHGGATRELAALTALALAGCVLAQRRDRGPGAPAGSFLAVLWFALSFVHGPGWVPLPPDPFGSRGAAVLPWVTAVAVAAAFGAGRDARSSCRR